MIPLRPLDGTWTGRPRRLTAKHACTERSLVAFGPVHFFPIVFSCQNQASLNQRARQVAFCGPV